ncbi:MAG TPA: hypothetical protein VFX02_02720 [Gammaproteobacteria bacterium]|nr:hypothetical protein [Gammaproteobacteria bacterium]
MGKVINFYSQNELHNKDIEQTLRTVLESKGFSPQAIEKAINTAMPLIKEAKKVVAKDLQITAPGNLNEEVVKDIQLATSRSLQQYQKDVSTFILKVIVQLILEGGKSSD